MRVIFGYRVVVLIFVIAGITAIAHGQTFEDKSGHKLQIEFVQDPPCPVKISVKSVDLNPETQNIRLQLENLSSTPIRAYAMISGGNEHPNLHTVVFAGAPFDPGANLVRGIWPNSQEHYYFFFDYILFADGSVCGLDNHHRSIQIASYLAARSAAMTRVKELAAKYINSEEIITALETADRGGYLSFDNPGPPNPDTIKSMPRRAYEHVILQLRRMDHRQKEAREIAGALEKEIPS